MRIYYKNYIDDATLTPSSAGTGQDVNNLKVPQLSKTFSFNGNNGTIVIDFGVPINIKSFIVDRGNLCDSAIVALEGNTTDSWGAPAFEQNLNSTDTAYYADIDETYRYYRLFVSCSSVVNVTLGFIHIGDEYLQMPGIDPEAVLSYETQSESSFSVSGQVFGNKRYRYLMTEFTFPHVYETTLPGLNGETLAGRQQLLEMWKETENINPFWVFLWANNLDEYPPVFAVLDQSSLTFSKKEQKFYQTSMTLREVK